MDSPRGRIWMMRKGAQGEAAAGSDTFRIHMDNCLGCMACVTACPSGVEYNKLIEDARGQVERNVSRPVADSLFRKLLFVTFPLPTPVTVGSALRSGPVSALRPAVAHPRKRACSSCCRVAFKPWKACCRRHRSTHSIGCPQRSSPMPQSSLAAASACSPAACRTPSSRMSMRPRRACSQPKASTSSSRRDRAAVAR